MAERTLGQSTAASTSRRVGGLSRFGGPARRVIPPVEEQEGQEDLAVAPSLISTFSLLSELMIASPKTSPRNPSPPRNSTRPRSPEHVYERPDPSPPPPHHDLYHRRNPSPPPAQPLIPSPPLDRPRPLDRYGEQENRPLRSTAHNYAASTSATVQRIPQPLQPAHMYSRSSDHILDDASKVVPYRSPPQQGRAEMIPSRAAPRPVEPPPRNMADTMPAAPVAVASQGKRSFMVS